MRKSKAYQRTPPKVDKKTDDAKYAPFVDWMGDWDVLAIRLAEFDPMKAQDLLSKCSKVWIAKAFATKQMFG